MVAALLVCSLLQQSSIEQERSAETRTHHYLFSQENLGSKHEVFAKPDSVTVLRVVPAESGEIRVGLHRMNAEGTAKQIRLTQVAKLQHLLRGPSSKVPKLCSFSPDHLITFRKGKEQIKVVTCFTCGDLYVPDSKGLSGSIPYERDLQTFLKEQG